MILGALGLAVLAVLAVVVVAFVVHRRSVPVIDAETTYVAESIDGEVVVRKDWRLTITNRGPVDLRSIKFALVDASTGRCDIDHVLLNGVQVVEGELGALKVGDYVSLPYRALRRVDRTEGPGHFGFGYARIDFVAKSLLFRWEIASVDIEIREYPIPARARCENGHLTAVSFSALDSIRRETSPSVVTSCAECEAPITASFEFS